MSQVLSFLQTVWKTCCRSGGHSWRVINNANAAALHLAIESRMKWERDDVVSLRAWCGRGTSYQSFGECDYTHAIKAGNISAILAYEHAEGRKPFFYVGHRGNKSRLHVGASLVWTDALTLEVTSFPDADTMIACEYAPIPGEGYRRAIIHRVTITRAELTAWNKFMQSLNEPPAEEDPQP